MTAAIPADVRAAADAIEDQMASDDNDANSIATAALAAADRARAEGAGDVVALLTQRAHLIEYGERVSADDVAVNYREAATLITTLRAELAATNRTPAEAVTREEVMRAICVNQPCEGAGNDCDASNCNAWDCASRVLALLRERGAAVPVWQPIETAPRDGTRVLATGGGVVGEIEICRYLPAVGAWEAPGYTLDDRDDEPDGYSRPTYWQPLPAPPAVAGKEGGG